MSRRIWMGALGALAVWALAAGCGSKCPNGACQNLTPPAQTTCDPVCSGATPVCDTSDFSCVQCLADADCTGGQLCDLNANTCQTPPPAGCQGDSDCAGDPAGAHCNAATGACQECVSSDQCTADANKPVCSSSGTCTACMDAGGCTGNGAEPLPPLSEDDAFFAPTLSPLPVQFSARTVNDVSADGIEPMYITRAEIVACEPGGDFTSQLVVSPNTEPLDCNSVSRDNPYEILVAAGDQGDDVEASGGMQHTFNGVWTPTAASTAGLSVTVRYFDSHDPPLSSAEYTLSFAYHQVNQAPQLQVIDPSGETEPEFTEDVTAHVTGALHAHEFRSSMGFHVRDVDSGDGITPMYMRILDDPQSHVVVSFLDPSGLIQTVEHGYEVLLSPIYSIDSLLSTAVLTVTGIPDGEDFHCRVSIEVHDQGSTGACSQEEPNICDKVATAMVYVDLTAPVAAAGASSETGTTPSFGRPATRSTPSPTRRVLTRGLSEFDPASAGGDRAPSPWHGPILVDDGAPAPR